MAHQAPEPRGAVVVPNWNGEKYLAACLESLEGQTRRPHIIVVDNGSVDGSVALVEQKFPGVELVRLPKNTGFTGGVNAGIQRATEAGQPFVALLNNDAVAAPGWFAALVHELEQHPDVGIAAAKITDFSGRHLDSTGEFYTIWGLAFARGRGESNLSKYDNSPEIFAASGGASILRTKMLEETGSFDNTFFAYYEDVDLSFRAQLAGWKIRFVPGATVRHRIGATSGKIRGFTTYQTLKNLPLLCLKNVPGPLLPAVLPRLWLAHTAFFWSAAARGQAGAALKGLAMAYLLTPRALAKRLHIQRSRRVPVAYIRGAIVHSLPPDAGRLQKLVHPLSRKPHEDRP
ncbi:MAG TPA: glycosyltransferase family 2 protein [Candidatus Saccharimonadales bacterium]|nr:glycosyltransferase family 2 protein [Candidatus Saccharimonadales bacterium]